MQKRGVQDSKFTEVVKLIAQDMDLPARCRPHKLSGQWTGYWECHIEPDWLLVYDLDDPEVVTLVATGTHADLFK